MDYKEIEPVEVLGFFEEICQIPHGSFNEKAISDSLVVFAKKRNLWVHQDSAFNVFIKKPATMGYEHKKPIILQAHLDMVAEKNGDVVHDFMTSPIKLLVDNGFIKAEGTTLGADNGIGVAMIMAVLDAKDINHPPIEAMLTTGEEVGMLGANVIDGSLFNGKTLINIDSEEEGIFTTSCAGGLRGIISIPVVYEDISKDLVCYSLIVKGLKGGHSGMDIHKERGNSNRLLARALNELNNKLDIVMASITGGSKENAIPREAEAIIAFHPKDLDTAREITRKLGEDFSREYSVTDQNVVIKFAPYSGVCQRVFTKELTTKIIRTILLLPLGVQAMSADIEGLVETSNNIGVVRMKDGFIEIVSSVRSSVNSRKYFLLEQIKLVSDMVGGKVTMLSDYPPWEYRKNSEIRDVFISNYRQIYGKEPVISAIHAGLECGVLSEKIKDVDMISFGPDIFDIHTPDEKLSTVSLQHTWEFFKVVLGKL